MNYYVGIDGGGTKTKLTVCNTEGEVLHSVISGPSNILSSGYETAKASITSVIQEGILDKGLRYKDCLGFCIGVAGAGRETVKAQIETILKEADYTGNYYITHDAETALVGGTGGDEGLLVIAGTGAICFGRNQKGETHRVSGWGHIIGDEGSAYSIGVAILNAVMKAYDGRGPQTVLTELLLERMGLKSVEAIIGEVYRAEVTKQHIADFAILIVKACEAGDLVAFQIVKRTATALYETVAAGIRALGFEKQSVKVVINGSVLVNNKDVYAQFEAQLHAVYPKAEIITMVHDAAYGAALIAKQL